MLEDYLNKQSTIYHVVNEIVPLLLEGTKEDDYFCTNVVDTSGIFHILLSARYRNSNGIIDKKIIRFDKELLNKLVEFWHSNLYLTDEMYEEVIVYANTKLYHQIQKLEEEIQNVIKNIEQAEEKVIINKAALQELRSKLTSLESQNDRKQK